MRLFVHCSLFLNPALRPPFTVFYREQRAPPSAFESEIEGWVRVVLTFKRPPRLRNPSLAPPPPLHLPPPPNSHKCFHGLLHVFLATPSIPPFSPFPTPLPSPTPRPANPSSSPHSQAPLPPPPLPSPTPHSLFDCLLHVLFAASISQLLHDFKIT